MILLIITLIEELNRGVTPDFRRCPKQLKNLGVKGSVREKLNPILTVTNFTSTDFFVCFCCNVMYKRVVLNLIKLFASECRTMQLHDFVWPLRRV